MPEVPAAYPFMTSLLDGIVEQAGATIPLVEARQTAVDAQHRIGDARSRVRVTAEAHTYRAFDAVWSDGVRDGMSRAAD